MRGAVVVVEIVRVVDAVMGPFFPSEPPLPTFVGETPTESILAPAPERDVGDYVIPADTY